MNYDTAITVQGQTLDSVCLKHYGRTAGVTEQVLAFNPGLASQGAVMPMGTKIKLPVINETATRRTVALWD